MILASKSPRRRELLKYITEDFVVQVADVDETLPDGIEPSEAVEYLSKIKATALLPNDDIVIGADTVVALDNTILGKPADENDAFRMLSMLSGREHSVYTGVTVVVDGTPHTFSERTIVRFHSLSDEEIWRYIKTGEPMDKAGAYGIQGYGSLLVSGIDGDYFNVVGLPVSKLNRLLLDICR